MNEEKAALVRDAVNKPWWKSKTLWFNLVSLGLYAASMAAEAHPEAKFVKEGLPYAVAAGNLILRGMTKQGVSLKGDK